MTLDERVDQLSEEVRKLKEKGKDGWDKLAIVCAAFVPLAIAGVGWYYTDSSRKSDQDATDARSASDSKLKQAELVARFFEPLTSADENARQLAIDSLLVAAPDYGPVLVKLTTTRADTPPATVLYAQQALASRRDTLVRKLFDDNATVRVDAYRQLLESWAADEDLIAVVIETAKANPTDGNGIYNSLVLLSHMQRDTIRKRADEIVNFAESVKDQGPKIRDRAQTLIERVRG